MRAQTPFQALLACGAIIAAILVAYHNSFGGSFVFDDHGSIVENPSFKNLSDLKALFFPTKNTALNSRPIINLSLALNYKLGGLNPVGYHVVNILIHLGSALALFGVIRRTLNIWTRLPGAKLQPSGSIQPNLLPAFSISLLWAVHPLLTESVTFVIQRTESLMGFFFLLTWYGLVRYIEKPTSKGWFAFTVVMCIFGMGSKEVMATAPVILFLYDRTFIAGSFANAWRSRKTLYLSLCATWAVLIVLVVQGGADRGGAAIVSDKGLVWTYLLTQCKALVLYLKLSFWPHPLIADYGTYLVKGPQEVLWQAVLVLLLLVGTVWSLVWRPALGFFGAGFFIILAPSSSFIPLITQTIAEHRMYLPLAFVLTGGVFALQRVAGKKVWIASLAISALFTGLTISQNEVYRTEQRFWADIVRKFPENPRAHNNLGSVLLEAGKITEARARFINAIELKPEYAAAYNNLGNTYKAEESLSEAIKWYEKALILDPNNPEILHNLGYASEKTGDTARAITLYLAALALNPSQVLTRLDLGDVYLAQREAEKALEQYRAALAVDSSRARTYNNIGLAMGVAGRLDEAIIFYKTALRLSPNEALVYRNLAQAYLAQRKMPESLAAFEKALSLQPDLSKVEESLADILLEMPADENTIGIYKRILKLKPDSAELHAGLSAHLNEMGQLDEAISHYAIVIQLRPNIGDIRRTYGDLLARVGRLNEAVAQYKEAVSLSPEDAEVYDRLGYAQAASGRGDEALKAFERAVQLAPKFAPAHFHFAMALAGSGRHREAIEHYETAISIEPSNAEYYLRKGESLLALGRRMEAVRQFQSACKLDPQNEEARKYLQQFAE
ncbi:MAG: tetratricopeptide repeat protein [Nibricoccus sp.]